MVTGASNTPSVIDFVPPAAGINVAENVPVAWTPAVPCMLSVNVQAVREGVVRRPLGVVERGVEPAVVAGARIGAADRGVPWVAVTAEPQADGRRGAGQHEQRGVGVLSKVASAETAHSCVPSSSQLIIPRPLAAGWQLDTPPSPFTAPLDPQPATASAMPSDNAVPIPHLTFISPTMPQKRAPAAAAGALLTQTETIGDSRFDAGTNPARRTPAPPLTDRVIPGPQPPRLT